MQRNMSGKSVDAGGWRTWLVLSVLGAVAVGQSAAAPASGAVARVSPEAAGMNPGMGEHIAAAVAAKIDVGDLPGCVVVIGRRAGIVFEEAYGHRSLEPETVPMTTDTVFDLASLTKPIATATSAMILIERGELRLRDKVAKFFPEFTGNGKEDVTVEQLLVHTSGLPSGNPINDYRDGWEAAKAKICALDLNTAPGRRFRYSDIGMILLGKVIEEVTGKPVDQFAKEEIYDRLGMHETGYVPPSELKARAAPTEQRDGEWLVGEVHDPRAALLDGVAGHAGLFSTASDLAIYAQTMLQEGRWGDARILGAATVREMTRPRSTSGQKRGLGWDMGSSYSRNRGETMSERAFGHGGFTGTAIWIDPELDLYVIFLANRLHPDGVGEVNDLAGRIGTIAAGAIDGDVSERAVGQLVAEATSPSAEKGVRPGRESFATGDFVDQREQPVARDSRPRARRKVKLGIDVLVDSGFEPLRGKRVGLITNHTGVDRHGVSTIQRLHEAENVELVALFSPEHGITGELDVRHIDDTRDEATGLPIYSLYGETRKPTSEHLASIDTLVFDIQDIGARFYTYISTMGMAMEVSAELDKEVVVLDRPNPIDGVSMEGPLLDEGRESFVAYHRMPVRHGMTVGELARMFEAEKELDVQLTIVPVEGWRRSDYLFDTNLTWINPSPNMRSLRAAVLYPGIGMMEFTNISVGRGTDTPFEVMGAPWIDQRKLAEKVNRANPPGVRVVPVRFTPTGSRFAGEECGGLSFVITDWDQFRSFELGLIVATALRELHPDEWEAERWMRLLGNEEVFRRVMDGDDVAAILEAVEAQVSEFRERRGPFELYE